LNENSFYHWRREIRLRDREAGGNVATAVPTSAQRPATTNDAPGRPPKLAPVVVIDESFDGTMSSSPTAIEIVLGDGTVVRVPLGSTREQLAAVLAVLEPSRC